MSSVLLPSLPAGTLIGFHDSNGFEFKVGDTVRLFSEDDTEIHGSWTQYTIVLRGIIPIILYNVSDSGQVLPVGGTAISLSDMYDLKEFLFSESLWNARPENTLIIIDTPIPDGNSK